MIDIRTSKNTDIADWRSVHIVGFGTNQVNRIVIACTEAENRKWKKG